MTSDSIIIVGRIVSEFADSMVKFIDSYCHSMTPLITIQDANRRLLLTNTEKTMGDLSCQFEYTIDRMKEINRLTSSAFNIIELFSPGETMHSYLLAYLLDPTKDHGQGNLFLDYFLEDLEIKSDNYRKNDWVVTAETGRIDILLKRRQPHSVVIIENKSNFASDRPHQLYRYWYQEIYKPLRSQNVSDQVIFNLPTCQYKLIYLAPEQWKTPEEHSICRPKELDHLSLPDKIPMKYEHITFGDFIVKWLNKCFTALPENNHRIREFITQYIEYWS